MLSKRYLWIGFVIMVLAQLWVPSQMIMTSERTIEQGEVFKFKTVPVDPVDPFRGKYIRLRYEVESKRYQLPAGVTVELHQEVYAILDHKDGYASIIDIQLSLPHDHQAYMPVTVQRRASNFVYIDVPIDKYFMEESLAQPAEDAVRALRTDTTAAVYGMVSVLAGHAVLQDVYINEETIAAYVRRQQANEQ